MVSFAGVLGVGAVFGLVAGVSKDVLLDGVLGACEGADIEFLALMMH